MSDNEEWPEMMYNSSNLPSFGAFASAKKAEQPQSVGGFDPYKSMLMKKQQEEGQTVDTSNTIKWPAEDVKRLEDFCKRCGIFGFNCGRMSPAAALSMLKTKLGVADTSPVESARGRYEDKMNQKTLLKG